LHPILGTQLNLLLLAPVVLAASISQCVQETDEARDTQNGNAPVGEKCHPAMVETAQGSW
jgi:hypothetical protein